jgi:DNA-binding beta-propeller fold protein YncE
VTSSPIGIGEPVLRLHGGVRARHDSFPLACESPAVKLRMLDALLATLCACSRAPNAAAPVVPPVSVVAPSAATATAAAPMAKEGEPPSAGPPQLSVASFPLPGANGPVTIDYLVCDRVGARVWVPVGDTGSVDVFDPATGAFARVDGFKTAERESHGKRRMAGPSAATVGEGFVYVGNRAMNEVCAIDAKTLQLGACVTLPTPTDGVAYVAPTKEVWVTTPRDHSLTVLDASRAETLRQKLVIRTEGNPEGYAVDSGRGVFYTNLEDKNRTLGIDIKTHAVKTTWDSGCGADGPRGIAVDETHNLVMVACTDRVNVLDGAHDGALLGKLDTGSGVDNIDWLESKRLLFVGAARAGRLTVAHIGDAGQATVVAVGDTPQGARNPVADAEGNAYEADAASGRFLVFPRGQ